MAAPRPRVRCSARRTNREPCGNFAMHGGRACHAHGGRAPQVRYRAQLRMMESRAWAFVGRMQRDERAKRAAVEPWADEIEPAYLRRYRPPAELRRIAREMTAVARELRRQASEIEGARAGWDRPAGPVGAASGTGPVVDVPRGSGG